MSSKESSKKSSSTTNIISLLILIVMLFAGCKIILTVANALGSNIDSNVARIRADAPEIVAFLYDAGNFNAISKGNTFIQLGDVDEALKAARFSDNRVTLQKVRDNFFTICVEPDKDSFCVITEFALQKFAFQFGAPWPPSAVTPPQ